MYETETLIPPEQPTNPERRAFLKASVGISLVSLFIAAGCKVPDLSKPTVADKETENRSLLTKDELAKVTGSLPESLFKKMVLEEALPFFKTDGPKELAIVGTSLVIPVGGSSVDTKTYSGGGLQGIASLRRITNLPVSSVEIEQQVMMRFPYLLSGNGVIDAHIPITTGSQVASGIEPNITLNLSEKPYQPEIAAISKELRYSIITKELLTIAIMTRYLVDSASLTLNANPNIPMINSTGGKIEGLTTGLVEVINKKGLLLGLFDTAAMILMLKALEKDAKTTGAVLRFTPFKKLSEALGNTNLSGSSSEMVQKSFEWVRNHKDLFANTGFVGNLNASI